MSLRSNARTFPVAFPLSRSGGIWETGGVRLPVGFWSSVETPDTFAATGTITLPSGYTPSMNFSDARNSGYVGIIGV